jgi:hypothetical protein
MDRQQAELGAGSGAQMVSPADARRILGPKGATLSDDALERLLADLYALAGIVIDNAREKRTQRH